MKASLQCIIVDDEEGAHLVLQHHIQKIGTISLSAAFFNAIEAMDFIYNNPVDLIFLDINMPGLTGMEMLKAMSKPPLVILTTAYSQYALESYKYQVVDYLVKPIEFSDFVSAIDKVINRYRPLFLDLLEKPGAKPKADSIVLKVDGNMIKVNLDTIIYIQSLGNYVKIHARNNVYLSPITTNEMESRLDIGQFRRIHKSYIIAMDRLVRIEGGQVHMDNGAVLPIGITFRRDLLKNFQ